jgi:hypothetical protein
MEGFLLRGFLGHLTAAMLAAHTMLGCCWHHAHACGQTHDPLAPVGWQHHEEPHHVGAGGCFDPSAQARGREDCRAVRCDFGVAKASPHAMSVAPAQPGVVTMPGADAALLRRSSEQHAGTSKAELLPVRLHLLHQVLLI